MRADDALVERATSLLRRLGSVRAIATAAELEAEWRIAWKIGLAGEALEARTRCLDAICGGGVFDSPPTRRAPTIRVRRGGVTRFRAIRVDGTKVVEAMSLRPESITEVDAPSAIVEELHADLVERTADLERAEQALPRLVRERPPVWAFWLWIVRWVMMLFAREQVVSRDRAIAAREIAEAQLRAVEEDRGETVPPIDGRERFLARLRALCEDRDVREIVVELDQALLPDGVDLLELPTTPVDATITFVDDTIRVTDDGAVLGTIATAVTALPALASRARANRLVQRARGELLEELATIDNQLEQAEIDFRNRIARLETLRLADPDRFLVEQQARIAPQIDTSINAILQHASTHLGTALAELTAGWTRDVAGSTDPRATAQQIDADAPAALAKIADDVRRLVAAGISGSIHDLHPTLVAGLRAHVLTDADLREPTKLATPTLDKLRSLTAIRAHGLADEIGGWFTGLFRSVKTKRAELDKLVAKYAADLHEAAMDELLEAEPELRAALTTLLHAALAGAVARQRTWLEQRLVDEQAAIATARADLAPRREVAEHVRRDLGTLVA